MDELDKEMKMSFIDEARQLLEAAEQCFLDLESSGGGPHVIENLFRLAHNMKGTSRAVGFGEVAEFTHQLENLLLKLKEGAMSVDVETVNLLLACNDHLKVMVETLSLDMDAKFDSRDLTQAIITKLAGGSIAGAPGAAKSPAAAPIEEAGESISHWSEPTPEVGHNHKADHGAEHEASRETPSSSEGAHPAAAGGVKAKAGANADETIRVSLGRLEKLSDFIGELVILQTVLNQHRSEVPSQLLQRTIAQLGKLSKEIQDISMSLRMIPVKQTFQKLQRIVRDTSKALDKQVDLAIEGESTEVDKTVLEQVGDPLVHIVRNAIDHGLEMPDEREKVGKARAGRVWIRAYHQGNNLVIEVQDDGKGIDPKKLLQKSIEKGLLKPGTTMSDQDAVNLIFAPGFSTKDQVSEISGRGVGLDVVKTNVEALGGTVHLESEVGTGSRFKIMLPLTLAIIDGMVVQIGDERYVVPVANVHETVQPKDEDVHYVTGRGDMLNLRGSVLPLFRLDQVLKGVTRPSTTTAYTKSANTSIAIVVNSRRSPFAVLVDDIVRQQQVVIKKLGPEIRVQKGLTGSAILGDGKPALILDLNDLVERVFASGGSTSATAVSSRAA